MRRLRVFRILVIVALAVLVTIVLVTMRGRTGPGRNAGGDDSLGPRIEGFTITDLLGEQRRLVVTARLGRLDEDGSFRVEGVERVEVARDEGAPLILSAERGVGSGTEGHRLVRLEGGVRVRDDEEGLELALASAEVDQANGVVRSLGAVTIDSPTLHGRAQSITYGLDGRPTDLAGFEIDGTDGMHLTARRGEVRDRGKDLVLSGDVAYRDAERELSAERIRILRGDDGRWREIEALGSMRGRLRAPDGGNLVFRSDAVHLRRADDGSVASAALIGDVWIEHGASTLAARRVDAAPSGGTSTGWHIRAEGDVLFVGAGSRGPARLQATSIELDTDSGGNVIAGTASGGVRVEGEAGSGEADTARFEGPPDRQRVTLISGSRRRARIAVARTRVTADTIESDRYGRDVDAQGRVEATLLPLERGASAAATHGMFDTAQAVHFIAARLRTASAGTDLRFTGDVRGWQSDRHLAADEVHADTRADALTATGHVSTRFPGDRERAASEAAFVQVSADRLDYRGADRRALYAGSVRARQSEGTIECATLEVLLDATASGIRRVTARDDVRVEFSARGGDGMPEIVTGRADRLVHVPAERAVRLFGDRRPAEVRREGARGGTTSGRVLRYLLDEGRIEVESGQHDGGSESP